MQKQKKKKATSGSEVGVEQSAGERAPGARADCTVHEASETSGENKTRAAGTYWKTLGFIQQRENFGTVNVTVPTRLHSRQLHI